MSLPPSTLTFVTSMGQALRHVLRAVDLGDSVVAESLSTFVRDVTDDHCGRFGTEFGCQLGGLRKRAERVLVEVALIVMQGVNQNAGHQISFLSSSQATIFSTVSLVSSSSMISPASFAGGGFSATTVVCEPASPT